MSAYSDDTSAELLCSSFLVKLSATAATPAQVVGTARLCLPVLARLLSLVLAEVALALLAVSVFRVDIMLLLLVLHVWMTGPNSRSDTLHCWNAVRQEVLAVATFVAHC